MNSPEKYKLQVSFRFRYDTRMDCQDRCSVQELSNTIFLDTNKMGATDSE